MNRCSLSLLVAAPVLAAASLCAAQPAATAATAAPSPLLPTTAGQRNFPANAQFGELQIDRIPQASVNGQSMRTAPGFRLFTPDNQLIFAHQVAGKKLRVAYVQEASTQWLLTAWILRPEEAQQRAAQR